MSLLVSARDIQYGDQRDLDHTMNLSAQRVRRRNFRLPQLRAPLLDLIPRARLGEVEALPEVNAEVEADPELLLGLDGLGDRAGADRVGAARHELHEAAADRVGLDVVEQRVADFQIV